MWVSELNSGPLHEQQVSHISGPHWKAFRWWKLLHLSRVIFEFGQKQMVTSRWTNTALNGEWEWSLCSEAQEGRRTTNCLCPACEYKQDRVHAPQSWLFQLPLHKRREAEVKWTCSDQLQKKNPQKLSPINYVLFRVIWDDSGQEIETIFCVLSRNEFNTLK